MCHLPLLMPIFGIPLFWLLPLEQALPIYGVILAISVWLYWVIFRSNKKPVKTGLARVLGTEAEVISRLTPGHDAQYVVRTGGELWTACCPDDLQPGETVDVETAKGIRLVVKRRNDGAHPDQPTGAQAEKDCAKAKKCHF